jgi:hypothetical protein
MRSRNVSRLATAAGAALALSLLLASTALASGPATSHRGTTTADCGGQTYTVAGENGGQNIGAVQVVDAFGHAILVDGTSTVTDTTTDAVLDQWTSGHGSGHDQQSQTLCVAQMWYLASDAYAGGPYPAGVSPDDTILYEIDFWVVMKV